MIFLQCSSAIWSSRIRVLLRRWKMQVFRETVLKLRSTFLIRFFIIVKVDSRVYNDLQALLEKKLGGPIEVEIVKGQPSQNQDAVKISTPETLVENDPTVKEFVKAFKGKISKIELNKERFQ